MKIKVDKKEIEQFISDAKEGIGRETEIGGDNLQVDMTVLKGDIPGHPELDGGTIRVFLNKFHRYIGHAAFGPKRT